MVGYFPEYSLRISGQSGLDLSQKARTAFTTLAISGAGVVARSDCAQPSAWGDSAAAPGNSWCASGWVSRSGGPPCGSASAHQPAVRWRTSKPCTPGGTFWTLARTAADATSAAVHLSSSLLENPAAEIESRAHHIVELTRAGGAILSTSRNSIP